MPINVKGHRIPAGSDVPDLEKISQDLSLSISDMPAVTSLTAANQLAATPGITFPVHVWRTDLRAHLVQETRGGPWIQVGGQDYFCVAEIARSLNHGETIDLHVDAFKERSEGWNLSAEKGIIIPETGMYTLEVYGRMDGIVSTTPGRRFFSYRVGTNVHQQKFPIVDDTSGGGVSTSFLQKGQVVWFRVTNETGARRAVYATLKIFRVGNPRIIS